jgi:hypothetical protein
MKKQQGSNSLPIACPNPKCGEVGWVPINRLDRQLVCRACGTRFYMDQMGSNMTIGERPDVFVDPFFTAAPERYRPNLIERVERAYSGLSARSRKILKAVIATPVLAGACLWVYVAYLKPGPKVPNGKDLNARAVFVVKAFSNDNPQAILDVSASGSLGDAKAWIRKAKPPTWPRIIRLPKAKVRVLNQSAKSAKAAVAVEIENPSAPEQPPTLPVTAPAGAETKGGEGSAQRAKGKAIKSKKAGATKAGEAPSTGEPEELEPAATEEIPKPEPPKPLKFGLYWVLQGDQWFLDLKTTLSHTQ